MTAKESNLTVVIPCYNEEESVRKFLPEVLNIAQENGWHVTVVNDGSTDSSAQALHSLKPHYPFLNIITHNLNKGYGAALKSGLRESLTEFSATMDSDGQHLPADIKRLKLKQTETGADLVIGARTNPGSGGTYRSLGKWLIRKIAVMLTDTHISDLNSGMKLYRTSVAKRLIKICPDTMAFSDIIALAFSTRKYLVQEVPISVRERTSGKSTIGINTAFDTVLEILNIVMLFNPIRIFLPIAVMLFLLGLLWGAPIMIAGRGVSVGAALLMLSGIMIFLLGLIAEQLAGLRKEE